MVDEQVVFWTLSSLLQGLCAIYGLFLVYYVYQRSKSDEYSRVLITDLLKLKNQRQAAIDQKDSVRTKEEIEKNIIESAKTYLTARRVAKRERVAMAGLCWVSIGFAFMVIVDVLGLIYTDNEELFWMGARFTTAMLVAIGIVFVIYSNRSFVIGTAAGSLTDEGKSFLFDRALDDHRLKPVEERDFRQEYEDIKKEWKKLDEYWWRGL